MRRPFVILSRTKNPAESSEGNAQHSLAHSPQHLCDLTPQTLERNRFLSLELKPHLKHAAETLRMLSETEITTDSFVFRDAVDLARTAIGRVCNYAFADLTLMMEAWRNGQCGAAALTERLDLLEILLKSCMDILEAHEDFSMWRSLCELEKSGTVNPSFEDTLKGNRSSVCGVTSQRCCGECARVKA